MKNILEFNNSSYSKIVEKVLLPAGDIVLGQGLMRRLEFLRKAQWWDIDQINTYQDSKLRELVTITYNQVPFYRHLLDISSIDPHKIRTRNDLITLPIVTKQMLRNAGLQNIVRSTGKPSYEAFTSGSTGENFRVIEDTKTAGFYRAAFMLSLEWAGWSIGQPHIQTGMTLHRSIDRLLKDYLLRCHYVSAYDLSDSCLDSTLDILEKNTIKFLWGYPGSIYFLARRAEERNWNIPLESVVTWGDTLSKHFRQTIEKVFRTKVFDTYGCAEGIQIAAQCGHGDFYHRHSLDTIVEIVNDEGCPVKSGCTGKVVLTRLFPGPMPFIRYEVGDIATESKSVECLCGRQLETLKSINGRVADVVRTPSGNRLIVHFFTGILESFPEIESFQILQNNINSITLVVVPTCIFDSHYTVPKIKKALKEKGADLDIDVEIVNEIPLQPTGKRRFIISRINSCS